MDKRLRRGSNPFTEQLIEALQGDESALNPRYRLIDLNRRSLVGGVDKVRQRIGTDFIDALVDRLLGVNAVQNLWAPCETCLAQHRCAARHSVLTLRDPVLGPRLRSRLTDALQACHQRGEIHVTARELRAAISYIFFGFRDCSDLHADTSLVPEDFAERAFNASSRHRQGELLAELARFDPALDSHPGIDRALRRSGTPQESLGTLRRRAYFRIEIAQGTTSCRWVTGDWLVPGATLGPVSARPAYVC